MPEQDPWPHFQRRAAACLRGDLTDRVLRQHRLTHVGAREGWQSLGLAALTAAACAVAVIVLGECLASGENALNYAAWSEVAMQTNLVMRP
jgi:hypothetical protein